MAPLLRQGDRVRLAPADQRTAPGNLLVAGDRGESLVCHRSVAVEATDVWLAADRSGTPRRYPRREILGVVTAIERDGVARPLGASASLAERLLTALQRRRLRGRRGLAALRRLLALWASMARRLGRPATDRAA
jgi:hypothetical protein